MGEGIRPMTAPGGTTPLLEIAVSALGGGGVTQFFHWLNNRQKTKAYTMGAVDHAVQTAMNLVTDRLTRVEAQHEDCEAKLDIVRADLAISRREIDRLMEGRVASLWEPPP